MKSKYIIILIVLVHHSVKAQMVDSIRLHIDSCLSILKENSLYSNSLHWQEIEVKVFEKAKTAITKADTFEALKIAFNALRDKHAAYYQNDHSYKLDNPELMVRYSDSIKVAWKRGPRIDGRMINDIAYFAVPYMGVNKQEQIDSYSNWLYDEVAKLQLQNPKGWVIDLRLNGGGNIRPMLAGLAMFFGQGIVSYYLDKDGEASDESAFSEGDFFMDGKIQASIKSKIPSIPNVKVAVLIGPGTASSGEITAAIFSERPNTLLLGEATAGLANATNGFVFNNNNNYFLISTARIANRHKNVFPEAILPSFFIKGNDAFGDVIDDVVVKKAIEWLDR